MCVRTCRAWPSRARRFQREPRRSSGPAGRLERQLPPCTRCRMSGLATSAALSSTQEPDANSRYDSTRTPIRPSSALGVVKERCAWPWSSATRVHTPLQRRSLASFKDRMVKEELQRKSAAALVPHACEEKENARWWVVDSGCVLYVAAAAQLVQKSQPTDP